MRNREQKIRITKQKKKKVCPICGHDEFSAIETRLEALVGQKFECHKCGAKFKHSVLAPIAETTIIRSPSRGRGGHKPRGRKRH
jgi:transposase-like protein